MGLFSSLFGKSGSDKADRLRQQALDAFGSIKTPELASLQVQLDKQVQQGLLTPEQAEAQLLGSNAFNAISTDPSLGAAQHQALTALQDTGTEGGLTAIDKSKLQDIRDEQNQVTQGRLGAIRTNAQQRGLGGSGLEMESALMNEQEGANRASKEGTDVAAQAQARALQALVAAGQQAGGMEAQQYGEQANKATSQNAIDKFNAETLNATNLYNTQVANQAQAANLAEKQNVADTNVATGNANKVYNAQQNQTLFGDNLQKAAGVAGVDTGWANQANKDATADKAGDLTITSGLINGATKAATAGAGGAPAAALTVPSVDPSTPGSVDPYGNHNSESFAHGGVIPGIAKLPGDNTKNDSVNLKAKVSPGEGVAVVPRSAMSDEDEFNQFMEQFKPQKKEKPPAPEHLALADLHMRVKNLEQGKR